MAIQCVSFMGKEGCIEPAKKVVKKAEVYIGKEPIGNIKPVEKLGEKLGDLRASDIEAFKISHGNINIKPEEPSADKIAEAWKAAHGIQ